MGALKEQKHYEIEKGMRIKSEDKNCLPDGLDTIQEKIEYVKSCYGIIGENGNLFDWLISEILPKEKGKIEELPECSCGTFDKPFIIDEEKVCSNCRIKLI